MAVTPSGARCNSVSTEVFEGSGGSGTCIGPPCPCFTHMRLYVRSAVTDAIVPAYRALPLFLTPRPLWIRNTTAALCVRVALWGMRVRVHASAVRERPFVFGRDVADGGGVGC